MTSSVNGLFSHFASRKISAKTKLRFVARGKFVMFEKHREFYVWIEAIVIELAKKPMTVAELKKKIKNVSEDDLLLNVMYLLKHDVLSTTL